MNSKKSSMIVQKLFKLAKEGLKEKYVAEIESTEILKKFS